MALLELHVWSCAGIVEIRGLSAGGAWTYFTTDLVDQSVRAYLLFESAGCFQRVVRDEGQDITNLLVSTLQPVQPVTPATAPCLAHISPEALMERWQAGAVR